MAGNDLTVKQVKALQEILNAAGFTDKDGKKLRVDGSFGPKTAAAVRAALRTVTPDSSRVQVRALQASLNAMGMTDADGQPLKADGLIGPRTLAALGKATESGLSPAAAPKPVIGPMSRIPLSGPPSLAAMSRIPESGPPRLMPPPSSVGQGFGMQSRAGNPEMPVYSRTMRGIPAVTSSVGESFGATSMPGNPELPVYARTMREAEAARLGDMMRGEMTAAPDMGPSAAGAVPTPIQGSMQAGPEATPTAEANAALAQRMRDYVPPHIRQAMQDLMADKLNAGLAQRFSPAPPPDRVGQAVLPLFNAIGLPTPYSVSEWRRRLGR